MGTDALRAPERVALLEVERVVDLCLEGLHARYVLDVGTGSGLFAEAFAARGLAVAAIDESREMAQTAQEMVPFAYVQRAPAEEIPFPDGIFDLVFLGCVLHEANDAVKALAEARRVSKARVAVLEWPHQEEPMGPPPARRLTAEQVVELAAQAGLEAVETIPLAHMVLYRMPVERA